MNGKKEYFTVFDAHREMDNPPIHEDRRAVCVRVVMFAYVLRGNFRSLHLITKWTWIGNGKLSLSLTLRPERRSNFS